MHDKSLSHITYAPNAFIIIAGVVVPAEKCRLQASEKLVIKMDDIETQLVSH